MFGKKRKVKKFRNYRKRKLKKGAVSGFQRKSNRPKKTSPFIKKIKKIFYLFLFSGLTIILIYLIFFSTYFKVTDINVSQDNLENQNLASEITKTVSSALGRNLVFIDTENLKIKVIDDFPELETVIIEKNYPHTLEINFLEYPLVANVINESPNIKKNYIINSIGYAIKEDLENPNLPYIKIKSDEPINPENSIIEANKLKYILDAIAYFEEKFGMRIIEVEYKKIAREIHLFTERNFYIWLDIQQSAEDQLKKLKKALVKLDIYNENLQYIDLRIAGNNGDKIIYKRK